MFWKAFASLECTRLKNYKIFIVKFVLVKDAEFVKDYHFGRMDPRTIG